MSGRPTDARGETGDRVEAGMGAGTRYEVIDLPTRPIFGFGIALAAIVLITAGILVWQFDHLSTKASTEQVPLHPLAADTQEPPEPRLLADPGRHYAEYLRDQRARLDEAAWIDRNAGLVRVPVARALQLVLEEGLEPR